MSDWVLILGCSTGHGGATAKRLAEDGYGIIGFHFDRGDVKKVAEEARDAIAEINGGRVHFWNTNAADSDTMDEYIPKIKEITGVKGKDLFMPLRLALSGEIHGPNLDAFSELMDREKIIHRLHLAKEICDA